MTAPWPWERSDTEPYDGSLLYLYANELMREMEESRTRILNGAFNNTISSHEILRSRAIMQEIMRRLYIMDEYEADKRHNLPIG